MMKNEIRTDLTFIPTVMSYSIEVAIPIFSSYCNFFSGGDINDTINELTKSLNSKSTLEYQKEYIRRVLAVIKCAKLYGAISVTNGTICQEYGKKVVKSNFIFCVLSDLQDFQKALNSFKK